MRMAMAAAILALTLGLGFNHAASAAQAGDREQILVEQLATAEDDFSNQAFDQVVQTLAPTVQSKAFGLLSEEMQYEALGLYARSLYRMGAFDDAHKAFIDLTENANATTVDWAFRADTAEKVGDDEDAELAQQELTDDDGNDSIVA